MFSSSSPLAAVAVHYRTSIKQVFIEHSGFVFSFLGVYNLDVLEASSVKSTSAESC